MALSSSLIHGSLMHGTFSDALPMCQYGWMENGNPNIRFTTPVNLAPLVRRKQRSSKKLVPLIEPDICNSFQMEFLPQTMIRIDFNAKGFHIK